MTADHPPATLSPREAAHLVGIGRSSIMRAIVQGTLAARRDNRNQWQIERDALDRWRADHGPDQTPAHGPDHGPDRTMTADHLELASARATIAQLEHRLADHAAVISDLRRRLDAETDERRRLTAPPSRSFLQWLLGR